MAMMKSGFFLFMSILFLTSSLSYGYKFNVGGKDGWAVKPSQWYSPWAQKNRFQINDTLCKSNLVFPLVFISKSQLYSDNIVFFNETV